MTIVRARVFASPTLGVAFRLCSAYVVTFRARPSGSTSSNLWNKTHTDVKHMSTHTHAHTHAHAHAHAHAHTHAHAHAHAHTHTHTHTHTHAHTHTTTVSEDIG